MSQQQQQQQQQQYPSPYPPSYPPYGYPPPPAGFPPGAGPAWGYTPGPVVGRPGILTAIGVVSIIVASISMLASFGTAGFGLMTRRIVQMQRVQASAAIASARVASQTPGQGGSTRGGPTILGAPDPAADPAEPELGPEGMEPPDRRVVATALDQAESLTPDQFRQLDLILAKAGKLILPTKEGTGLTVRDVLFAIRDHGNLLSDDPKDPDPVHFDFATGQLQLHSDRALFRAANRNIIRSAVPRTGPGDATGIPSGNTTPNPPQAEASAGAAPGAGDKVSNDPFAPDASGGTGSTTQPTFPFGNSTSSGVGNTTLNAAQIQTIVQKVQAASGNRLNPAQLATLRTQLRQPNQQLVPPGMAWSPVSMAMVQPDGSAFLRLPGGYLMMDAQGTVTNQMSAGIPTTVSIHPMSMVLVLGESAASMGLAVLLLVAGLLVLRQSPIGRRLHLIYALIKLPLAIAGGIGIVWLATGMANTFSAANGGATGGGGGGGGGAPPAAIGWAIALALGGAIYPVALLVALNLRGVRDYYRAGMM